MARIACWRYRSSREHPGRERAGKVESEDPKVGRIGPRMSDLNPLQSRLRVGLEMAMVGLLAIICGAQL